MFSLLLAFAAIAQPQERVFDDWAVASDNVKRCEATETATDDGNRRGYASSSGPPRLQG